MKKYYLAYGSNLNLKQMEYRCPNAQPIGAIKLNGYKLVYKGGADNYAYLTIEPDKDSFVPLGLFELSPFDIYSLDSYEGYPTFYSKMYIPVKINDKTKKALIYVMNDGFDYHLPSIQYVKTCMDGYKDFGFDADILRKAFRDTYQNLDKPKRK